jgi:hypothetical protein
VTASIEQVTRPVTIALVGTHSTGKTTFVHALADRLRRNRVDVAVVNDLGVNALELGLPILWNHTWASTMWIITRGISLELEAWLEADVLLVDRGIPDALGYYEAALAYRGALPEPERLEQLGRIVADHAQHYDLILRTELDPSIPLGAEKPRDTDMRYPARRAALRRARSRSGGGDRTHRGQIAWGRGVLVARLGGAGAEARGRLRPAPSSST